MNSRRSFLSQLALGTGALTLSTIPQELFASGELKKLTIVHTNDMHCHIDPFPLTDAEYGGRGGMIRLASLVARIRSENPDMLLLDAGDMFQGTPYFNFFKGNLMLKVMSKMGYDACTIGNHEFDNGLGDMFSAFKYADFPIVSSNYDFSDTILANRVEKYTILKRSGIKIGIYGLGIELDGLVGKANYGNTIFLDPLTTALKMERFLKIERKCNLVVCLSHLGFSYQHAKISDSSLVPQTQFTDLIIGGHTHTFLESPVVLKNAEDKPVVVNQVGWAALAAGKIEFVFDTAGGKAFTAVVNQL